MAIALRSQNKVGLMSEDTTKRGTPASKITKQEDGKPFTYGDYYCTYCEKGKKHYCANATSRVLHDLPLL